MCTRFPYSRQRGEAPECPTQTWSVPRVGGSGASRGLTIIRSPVLVLPRGDLDPSGQRLVNALPVDAAITGLGYVGEDGVSLDGLDSIGVGLHRGAGSNTKKSIFWVDGP